MGGKYNFVKKTIFLALGLILILFSAITFFSPYGKLEGANHRLIAHSIVIEANTDHVFKYLGKSDNASKWSVYVDHIEPLNTLDVRDGDPGSKRRCYCESNEMGRKWDELITEVIPGKKRRLLIYNLVNFPVTVENLATEQIYEPLGVSRCRVTFTVFFTKKSALLDELKMYFAAYQIKKIFNANMINIKDHIENEK